MNYEKEKKMLSLMAARRSEAFWSAQAARIRAGAARRPSRAWLLVPAAAAAVMVALLARPRVVPPPPAEAQVTVVFLENLDLLDDMDVLEAVPEEEL